MSIAFKIVILVIYILAFAGCFFWWKKEGGWEPKVATLTMLATLALFIYDFSKDSRKQRRSSIAITENNNSPIANNIETQNNYYSNIDTSLLSKVLESKKDSGSKRDKAKSNDKFQTKESSQTNSERNGNHEILQSLTIEARLTCSLKENAEIPPTEVDFDPVGGGYAFFQNNAEKHPLKFNSPVLFRLINGNRITIINKYSLDKDSDLLLSPINRLSKFNFIKVPIITVVYGVNFEKMLQLELNVKINGKEVWYETWAYDAKFETGPTFDIPLTKLINQIQATASSN